MAQVTIEILTNGRPVYLTGPPVREDLAPAATGQKRFAPPLAVCAERAIVAYTLKTLDPWTDPWP